MTIMRQRLDAQLPVGMPYPRYRVPGARKQHFCLSSHLGAQGIYAPALHIFSNGCHIKKTNGRSTMFLERLIHMCATTDLGSLLLVVPVVRLINLRTF